MEEQSRIFKALGSEVRLALVEGLHQRGEQCVNELVDYSGTSQSNVSQSLLMMRHAGLVVSRKDGQRIYYRLADKTLPDIIRRAAELKLAK